MRDAAPGRRRSRRCPEPQSCRPQARPRCPQCSPRRRLAMRCSRRPWWWHEDRLGRATRALRRRALDLADRRHRRPRAGRPRVRRARRDHTRRAAGPPRVPPRGFRQRLMLDPPQGVRGDAGWCGRNGRQRPLRTRFGTPRDLVDRRELRARGRHRRSQRRQGREERRRLRHREAADRFARHARSHHGARLPAPPAPGGVEHRDVRIAVRRGAVRVRHGRRPAAGHAERRRPALARRRRRRPF